MDSWLAIPKGSDFPLENLPFGVFSTHDLDPRIGVAIGHKVLDLRVLAEHAVFKLIDIDDETLKEPTLNRYASLGRSSHTKLRSFLQDLLRNDTPYRSLLRDNSSLRDLAVLRMESVKLHLPMIIGDYTDFFTSPYHAKNCSDIFRPGAGIPAAFYHMPMAYHGRASSIVVSGTAVRRPCGQVLVDGEPCFAPSSKLDFEVEFAAFVGKGNEGNPIDINNAEEHIFGYVLMNDWSARDIQRAEATPLGPFNGKNFATTISPWVVTLEAIEEFRTSNDIARAPLPYLQQRNRETLFDIPIKAGIQVQGKTYDLFECNTKNSIFSFAQMLAHHCAGGCTMRAGDLIASGTLSGSQPSEVGCLLEATRDGRQSYKAFGAKPDEEHCIRRLWLEDGDNVIFTASMDSKLGDYRIGFGACQGKVAGPAGR